MNRSAASHGSPVARQSRQPGLKPPYRAALRAREESGASELFENFEALAQGQS
jgi:hypothetical protein